MASFATGDNTSSDSSSDTESVSSPSSSNSLSGFESDASTETETSDSDSSSSSANSTDDENTTGSSTLQEATNSSGYETNEKLELPLLNPRKQRARLIQNLLKRNAPDEDNGGDEDGDNGLECSLCMQNCEMSGEHRLCSLKCGHFFGESCIRIRLKESACPECKTKARQRHIRYLYAKRLKVIDRSEEQRVREQLRQERIRTQILEFELDSMKMSYADVMKKMQQLEANHVTLRGSLERSDVESSYEKLEENVMASNGDSGYSLVLDRNIAISRKPCCRIMKYADKQTKLIVSQKGFFPGYGLRLMNAPSFESSNYLYTSQKMVCDITMSAEQNLIAVASKERSSKLFDLRNYQAVTVFKPGKVPILSCAISSCQGNENELFLGSHQGCIYVYDIRNPGNYRQEHKIVEDTTPVIQIEIVKESLDFPCGGFIICQKTSLWFYEIRHSRESGVLATCLISQENIVSMNYNKEAQTLLVQLGTSLRQHRMRHILGKLTKLNATPTLQILEVYYAKTSSPVTSRSTQIRLNNNNIVAAYAQDQKLLSLFATNETNQLSIQSYPVTKIIYDLCPIYMNDLTYLAALNKSKCFIYKLSKSGSLM
ncbi:E3 ubiquitin-protein ligase RFWD3 [Musca domestica]|uniref:RING-type E3 ubiquitin transferase n=1 Tax=Musca domestica TaxID=7370 RepID=A0A1I8MHM4_MUSDO|nr:E3 ubiquitin-protein ligase RFWD3 [Musca domestica]XP_019891364.1 E3 ubiquitin-protein ligase RFWD3 [Musca domestica]XP_058975506.1 E3 ubiquitin-protein ligase RFWD3 [Musca domestica]